MMTNKQTLVHIRPVFKRILVGPAVSRQDVCCIYILLPGLILILVSACHQPMKQVEIETPQAAVKTRQSPEITDSNEVSTPPAPQDNIDTDKVLNNEPLEPENNSSNNQVKHNLTTRENNPVVTDTAEKQLPKVIKPQPVVVRGRKTIPGQNKFYDRKNPEYQSLQKANHALAGFPVDTEGQINWVLSLDRGKIKPRTTVRGNKPMETLETEIIMKNTREMAYVRFPHKAHSEWLACKNCHEEIFIPDTGANDINMTRIFQGEYCGICHDKVAFSSFVCERCHSIPASAEQ